MPPQDGDVHQVERLWHPNGHVGPALVSLVTDAVTNEPLSIHRTWVRTDGRKASVEPPRLLAKGHPIPGGVIRIWPDEAVTSSLGVAEGIETALSCAHAFTPIWATIDASHMAKLPILNGVEALTVFADNDANGTGLKAANDCGRSWAAAGRKFRVLLSPVVGRDWNDEVAP